MDRSTDSTTEPSASCNQESPTIQFAWRSGKVMRSAGGIVGSSYSIFLIGPDESRLEVANIRRIDVAEE
jgi:hypothetical protein